MSRCCLIECVHYAVLSDDVPLVVSRQLLQTFAQEFDRLEPDVQKEVAHYTLNQIQPRVVSFEEQVCFDVSILFLVRFLTTLLQPIVNDTWTYINASYISEIWCFRMSLASVCLLFCFVCCIRWCICICKGVAFGCL